jgi:hypothetical protein
MRGMERPVAGMIDAIFVTPASADEALYFAQKSAPRLTPDGLVWVVFPIDSEAGDGERIGESDVCEMFAQRGFQPEGKSEIDGKYVGLAFCCGHAGPMNAGGTA